MKKLMLAGLIVLSAVSFARHGGNEGDCGNECVDTVEVTYSAEVLAPICIEWHGANKGIVDFGTVWGSTKNDVTKIISPKENSKDLATLKVRASKGAPMNIAFDGKTEKFGDKIELDAEVWEKKDQGNSYEELHLDDGNEGFKMSHKGTKELVFGGDLLVKKGLDENETITFNETIIVSYDN